MKEEIILIVAILVIIAILITVLKFCSNFRNKVYQLFIKAENEAESGQKMDYVVEHVYSILPYPISLFINESALRWILQKMFDVIKDFLDDGKINNRGKK